MEILASCNGHLEGVQHSLLIYGYIEAVVWGVLTGSVLLFMLMSVCCKGGRRSDVNSICSCTCNYLLIVLVICGVLQVIFDVTLIQGLQHQNSALVLSYFVFGVISDILRVPLCIVMLVINNGQNASGPDKVDNVTRGFSIAGLIFTVLHCGVLWVVFKSYLQIKSFPHCLL